MMMADIAMHILDIGMNSITSNTPLIEIVIHESQNEFIFTIKDYGKGMDEETLKKAVDPFYTSRQTRKVGLGIPFIKAACEMCGGYFEITSQVKQGTTLIAGFKKDNIDCPPIGDIGDALVNLIIYDENIDFKITYEFDDKNFLFDSVVIKEELEGVSMQEPTITQWLKQYINENIQLLKEERL